MNVSFGCCIPSPLLSAEPWVRHGLVAAAAALAALAHALLAHARLPLHRIRSACLLCDI